MPGEQGVPFGSGFKIAGAGISAGPPGEQSVTVPAEGEDGPSKGGKKPGQPAASFLVGTKGIVAYTAYIEESDSVVLLELDWCPITPK